MWSSAQKRGRRVSSFSRLCGRLWTKLVLFPAVRALRIRQDASCSHHCADRFAGIWRWLCDSTRQYLRITSSPPVCRDGKNKPSCRLRHCILLGTFINGGCVFGIVARIASGNLSFLTALPGMALGAGFGTVSALPRLSFVSVDSPLSEPGIAPLAVLIVAAGFACLALAGIARAHRRAGLRIGQVLRASRWRTSLAMMIIGVLGGLLFATGMPWSYPALLKQLGNLIWGEEVMFDLPVIVGPVALFAGAITAAAAGGRFALRPFVGAQLARSLAGGAVMGFATILIPGAN